MNDIGSGVRDTFRRLMVGPKQTIAILTGGGDVPGLNPAIRAITIRALREGYRVLGIRRGWAGLVDYDRTAGADNSQCVQELSPSLVNRAGRTGGTFLHTSRTRPSHLPLDRVPDHLTGYDQPINDVTADVLRNLEHIGADILIPIGARRYAQLRQAPARRRGAGRGHPQDDGQRCLWH